MEAGTQKQLSSHVALVGFSVRGCGFAPLQWLAFKFFCSVHKIKIHAVEQRSIQQKVKNKRLT